MDTFKTKASEGTGRINKDTIIGIGSITKQFTAATLLKLWDNEIELNQGIINFPKGIDTNIYHYMERLESRFPACDEIFQKIKNAMSFGFFLPG